MPRWTRPTGNGSSRGLRYSMTNWYFAEARSEIEAFTPVAAEAMAVQEAARRGGEPVPEALQEIYQARTANQTPRR